MKISTIIVNYQAWGKLSDCLNTLTPLIKRKIIAEIIVVDNASPTDKISSFQKRYPSVQFIGNTGNNGFANGCNYGASLAQGDTYLFLNPDTIVNEEAIAQMGKALIENKNITILSCSQTDTKGRPSKSSGRYKQYAWSKKIAQSASCHSESKHENLEQVDWVSGSVVMISRANFEKHQGWNEDYWMYCEDEDFCRRVNNNGGSVYLLKSASIIHAHGGSSRINPRTAALTKTEVLISTHLYFHNFLEGSSKSLLNAYIVTSNLITHLLLAVIALPLFFIRKMRIKFLMLFFLLHYYCKAMISGNWKSPRIQK